jgi:DNA-3-methyladenine glycosylase
MRLNRTFYEEKSVTVAQTLLGCILISEIGQKNERTSGIIIETEAYGGESDPGSHAFKGKTKRTQILYGEAGRAYVYLIYGKHYLLNVVTEKCGTPGAVLIRALEPVEGITIMKKRRQTDNFSNLTSGPGKVTQALGITSAHNGLDLTGTLVWVESYSAPEKIHSSSRIGVKNKQDLRFYIEKNTFVSLY